VSQHGRGDGKEQDKRTFFGFSRYSKRVFSSHVTPLLTLAAVYEKPST
jgi:hypothetical protein